MILNLVAHIAIKAIVDFNVPMRQFCSLTDPDIFISQ